MPVKIDVKFQRELTAKDKESVQKYLAKRSKKDNSPSLGGGSRDDSPMLGSGTTYLVDADGDGYATAQNPKQAAALVAVGYKRVSKEEYDRVKAAVDAADGTPEDE